MGARKHLSLASLLNTVKGCLHREKFEGAEQSPISWTDCILSGLAVFNLKYASLLAYDAAVKEGPLRQNLKRLFGIENPPSDTCMRERLDELSPEQLRRPFKKIFAHLQRGKVLEGYRFLGGYHIISLDGTGQYSSKKVHCDQCCEKTHRSGKVTYYHHMLGAALVHPDHKVVFPLAPEPITKGDGSTKNDCERNASKRLLKDLRREHPHLKVCIVEDALASNQPHLSLLESLKMKYVIGVKPGDHGYLFDWINALEGNTYSITDDKGVRHQFTYYNGVPLNSTHHDFEVNVITYIETKPNGKTQRFSWVTNFPVTDINVFDLMRAGRSRWRIENETFNTLKNQGYHFEHNYGHGYKNLCSVFTMLMLLAFLVDQVQEHCCDLYKKARVKCRTKYGLFEKCRVYFCDFEWLSWNDFYTAVISPKSMSPPD